MKISGFSMGKNTHKLYYPMKEAVLSILPIVDEYVIALGDSDADDTTREELLAINSDKIKIIDTVWDIEAYPSGMEHAHQTDIAKEACTGDWLIHLQADEIIHEQDHQTIIDKCQQRLNDTEIEGFLFQYHHFYGDYNHLAHQHGWYQNEIRIIRNDKDIHSFWSAQSFRRIPNFDGVSYKTKEGTQKLKVEKINAHIYHYGWVRPPRLMQNKSRAFNSNHKGKSVANAEYDAKPPVFDYGNMSKYTPFTGSHPAVMKERIKAFDWSDDLHFEKNYRPKREKLKHEKLKYRILTAIEQRIFQGKHLFPYANWIEIKR